MYDGIPYQVKQGAGDQSICESRKLRKNEETRLDAFEKKGLRKILRVSWTAKKTNEWVLNKAGVNRELLDTVKARKLAYCGHTTRKYVCPFSGNDVYPHMPILRPHATHCHVFGSQRVIVVNVMEVVAHWRIRPILVF